MRWPFTRPKPPEEYSLIGGYLVSLLTLDKDGWELDHNFYHVEHRGRQLRVHLGRSTYRGQVWAGPNYHARINIAARLDKQERRGLMRAAEEVAVHLREVGTLADRNLVATKVAAVMDNSTMPLDGTAKALALAVLSGDLSAV